MPVLALWSLVICLAGLALGLAYKVAELTHRADRINKEAETLRSELNALQKSKDKEISDIKEFHQREVEELRKTIEKISYKKAPSNPDSNFVKNGGLKWKVSLVNGHIYNIEDTPFCIQHDLQMDHVKNGYSCFHIGENGCTSQLSDKDYSTVKKYVESLKEQQFRK